MLIHCNFGVYEGDNMIYDFYYELRKNRIVHQCVPNVVFKENITKELGDEFVLNGDGENLAYDEEEFEIVNYIRGYLQGNIRCCELK